MIDTLILLPGTIVWATWVARAALVAAHMYQIEEYETLRFFAWGHRRKWLLPPSLIIATTVCAGLQLLLLIDMPIPHTVYYSLGLLGAGTALHLLWHRIPPKKPMVYTPRMRRIVGAAGGLLLLFTLILLLLWLTLPTIAAAILAVIVVFGSTEIALLLVVMGNMAMAPVEASIQRTFLTRARERILSYHPQVIGIAGSFGKTSTKHITAHMMSPFITTFPTPKSYNTLMGITRTINEYLEPNHALFLVEMDAYAAGEIRAICDLVSPTMAIITSVGAAHLERFGTIERIGNALYELVAALPAGSTAIIYSGEHHSAQLAQRAANDGYRVVRYGLHNETPPPDAPFDVIATDVIHDGTTTHFTWRWQAHGLQQRVSLPLLGKHNILNVCAALIAAHELGLPLDAVAPHAAQLKPVPHRLQLLPTSGGVTVIDDSYNANPVGVHNGLEVLQQMPGRSKVLITPGMVELGALHEEENRRYGEHAAHVCDHVILVGKQQTIPIQQGLQQEHFAQERMHIVQTLDDVTALLGRITVAGDVVLFANDLPDTYLE